MFLDHTGPYRRLMWLMYGPWWFLICLIHVIDVLRHGGFIIYEILLWLYIYLYRHWTAMFLDHTGPSRRAFCPYICRAAVLSSQSRERGLTYSFLLWHLPIMFCTLDPIWLLHKICIQTPQLCINPISKIMIFFPRQAWRGSTCSPGVKNAMMQDN